MILEVLSDCPLMAAGTPDAPEHENSAVGPAAPSFPPVSSMDHQVTGYEDVDSEGGECHKFVRAMVMLHRLNTVNYH